MKLYDVLKESDKRITVRDKDRDFEGDFYGEDYEINVELERWNEAMLGLSKLLDITDISDEVYTVNLTEVIRKGFDKLNEAGLIDYKQDGKSWVKKEVDDIINDVPNIFKGRENIVWLENFVRVLGGDMEPKQIDINNGMGQIVEPEEALKEYDLDTLAVYMDDETREYVHYEIAPCTDLEFLKRYLELAPYDLIIG